MTSGVALDSVLRHTDDLASVEVDGEMVIYEPVSERFHRLDNIGTTVWQLLDGRTTLQTTCTELSEGFAAPLDVVSDDVLKLAQRLFDDGLVEMVEGSEVMS